jgi:hypothetical protein
MDALQVVRITHDDYPRGCEIILIAMYWQTRPWEGVQPLILNAFSFR